MVLDWEGYKIDAVSVGFEQRWLFACPCTCGFGLWWSPPLPLPLYVLQAPLNVVLEVLGRHLQERVKVCLRVLLLEVVQVVQSLCNTNNTFIMFQLVHVKFSCKIHVHAIYFHLLTSMVFSLDPIFLNISANMSCVLLFNFLGFWWLCRNKQPRFTLYFHSMYHYLWKTANCQIPCFLILQSLLT